MANEETTVHHEDHEWESQREAFTQYYKIENKTLREAAKCMVDNHNFHATPRQWERKVKAWSLEKYTTRTDRLRQIQSQGRSIHEVARAGRRNKSYDASLLHPEDQQGQNDRNIRRFARRELSRSRSRSRSNSFGQRTSRSASPFPAGEPGPEEVIQEDVYGLDFSPILQSGSMRTQSDVIPVNVTAVATGHDVFATQAHVLHVQNQATGETNDELFLSLPEQRAEQDLMEGIDSLGHDQYDFTELDRRFSLETPITGQANDLEPASQFPLLDTTFTNQDTTFIPSQTVNMEDISPTISGPHGRPWAPQATYASQTPDSSRPFFSSQASQSGSYHVTPTHETGPTPQFPTLPNHPDVPGIEVPELVFPASSPSPSPSQRDVGAAMQGYQLSQTILDSDQSIYADFYANVNRFSQAILEAAKTSAYSSGNPTNTFKKLGDDVASESTNRIIQIRPLLTCCPGALFFQDMTVTLNNFVLSQQRAVQSMHDSSGRLKQQRNMLQLRNLQLEEENRMMKQLSKSRQSARGSAVPG